METLTVGYGHKSNREEKQFRTPKDLAEMVAHCNASSHIWFRALDGTAKRAKVNGMVRTWKRNPNRIEVPLKYGMYEYSTFTAEDINRVLIPIE